MINWFLSIDTELFLFLNSLNHSSLDPIMDFLSYNMTPGFLIIGSFLFLTFKKYRFKCLIPLVFLLITFGLADSISSRVFKPGFKRLRPMHEPAIKNQVYLAGHKAGGGKYGFVSSHAANTFAVCTFIFLFMRRGYPIFKYVFVHSTLVSYSRIYLGKHYPLDLIFGAILGIILGYLAFKALQYFQRNWLELSPYQS